MKEKIKALLLNLLLIFGLAFFALLIHVVYIAGPNRAYEREDRLYVERFQEVIEESGLVLLNRFAFDDVYYIVVDQDRTTLYWFNRDMDATGYLDYQDLSRVDPWIQEQEFVDYELNYGVYQKTLVYVVSTTDMDYFLDFETQEVLLKIGVTQ